MKVIISKSPTIPINKVHFVVKTQHQSGSMSIRKTKYSVFGLIETIKMETTAILFLGKIRKEA